MSHNMSPKAKVLEQNLGTNYEAFTRKIPFYSCINQAHCHIKSNIIQTCAAARDITFRAKVFVNYYVLSIQVGKSPMESSKKKTFGHHVPNNQ